ncbi:ROK family protein [Fodinisporobacter ferrooxydans]|uniref:ROK family protein n=1 Tax=Fodinisporobacter ferrooxydans TaxID=2901836 RepID=A0ABY4CNX2_9BACL|nr:ROK family protein [Alicyclobacillaceae bacterium MYW30-H2]
MASYTIGVDIGGTKIAIGVVDEKGAIHAKTILPTDHTATPTQMVDRIQQAIHGMLMDLGPGKEHVLGIGIGVPGPIDKTKGKFLCPPNLPKWANFAVVDEFQKYFSLPIQFENDANAATLGEKWIGAAKDNRNFVYITISTGIGAGLYINGGLVSGASGNAGEAGHIVIDPGKGTCRCGQKGCFEWVASGTAIARQGSELLGKHVTAKEVFQLYQEGHPAISSLISEIVTYIGMGCVTLINLFDPEKIVIGGGVSEVGEVLFAGIQNYVRQYALSPKGRETAIVPAALRQDTGIIGAAALIFLR